MVPNAFGRVATKLRRRLEILETEFADEQLGQARVFFRVGTLIPHFHFVAAKLDVTRSVRIGEAFQSALVVIGSGSLD